jgi:CBS-domain-containing membrane protein
MNVRKHMSAPPITISDETDFKNALGLMQRHRIRRLPVVDAGGVLIGIVAERDLLVAADRYLNSPVDVERIMTREVVTVGVTTPVVDAAMLMIERKIGGLPVVDPSRKLLGIITETDLLKALAVMLRGVEQSTRATRVQSGRTRSKKTTAGERSASKRPIPTKPQAKSKSTKTKAGRSRPPAARKRVKRPHSD